MRKRKPGFWRSKVLTQTAEEGRRSMAGKASRAKGLAFERRVAELFRAFYPDARRQLEFHTADAKGVDLQNTGPFKVQCKKLRAYAPVTTMGEIEADRNLGEIPLLVTAGDGLEPMVVLHLEDFFRLLAHWDFSD